MEQNNYNKKDLIEENIIETTKTLDNSYYNVNIKNQKNKCPDCNEELNHREGCVSCISCGFSKCN